MNKPRDFCFPPPARKRILGKRRSAQIVLATFGRARGKKEAAGLSFPSACVFSRTVVETRIAAEHTGVGAAAAGHGAVALGPPRHVGRLGRQQRLLRRPQEETWTRQ